MGERTKEGYQDECTKQNKKDREEKWNIQKKERGCYKVQAENPGKGIKLGRDGKKNRN